MKARSPNNSDLFRRLIVRDNGAALIELAFSLPILLLFLSGILAYGSWFYTAQSLQLVANNAARAAIAGLSVAERRTIALTSATSALRDASLDPAKGTITVTENAQMVQVSVQYDVSAEPMLQLPFVPLPGKIISTRASVMVGGLT